MFEKVVVSSKQGVRKELYQSHVITKHTASIFLPSVIKKSDTLSLILSQECIDGAWHGDVCSGVEDEWT